MNYLQSLDYVQPGIGLVGLSFGAALGLWLSTIEENKSLKCVVAIGAPHYIQIPCKWKNSLYPSPYEYDLATDIKHEKDEYGAMDMGTLIYDESCEPYRTKLEQSPRYMKYLFIVGLDDGNLEAKRSFDILNTRMKEHGREDQVECFVYPNAGHFIDPPYIPQTVHGLWFPSFGVIGRCGGTLQGNFKASKHSWTEMVKFLKKNVGVESLSLIHI